MKLIQRLLPVLLCMVLLCACVPQGETPMPTPSATPAASPTPVPAPSPTPEPTPVPTPEPTPQITTITISAVGDVTLGTNQKHDYPNSFHAYYDTYGKDYFLQNVRDVFAADDFTLINFEGTLTESEEKMDKLWNHKGRPEYINILADASIEGATLGNNHIMDYLQQGVDDTTAAFDGVGIEYALSGPWGNRYGLYETKGIKIGFVSVNENYDEDAVYPWLEEGLKTLREQGADLVFACIHWGTNYIHEPEPVQYVMGKWCIDQGYDLVLGCHPHVLHGIECYKGKFIVHSLGNFCYGGSKTVREQDTMIFQQTFAFVDGVLQPDAGVIRVIPCWMSGTTEYNNYCPEILSGEEAEKVIANLNIWCEEFCTRFDADGYLIECHDTSMVGTTE